jgi:hypothetical protein
VIASVLIFLEERAAGTGVVFLLVAIIAAFIVAYGRIGLFVKWLCHFALSRVIAGSIFALLTFPGGTAKKVLFTKNGYLRQFP